MRATLPNARSRLAASAAIQFGNLAPVLATAFELSTAFATYSPLCLKTTTMKLPANSPVSRSTGFPTRSCRPLSGAFPPLAAAQAAAPPPRRACRRYSENECGQPPARQDDNADVAGRGVPRSAPEGRRYDEIRDAEAVHLRRLGREPILQYDSGRRRRFQRRLAHEPGLPRRGLEATFGS